MAAYYGSRVLAPIGTTVYLSLGSAGGDLVSAESHSKATVSVSDGSTCELWSPSTGGTALALKLCGVLVKEMEKIMFAGRKTALGMMNSMTKQLQ